VRGGGAAPAAARDVGALMDTFDLHPGRRRSLAHVSEGVEEEVEPLLALRVTVRARRMEAPQRRVGDQVDAASSSRAASRARPSASAATAPARQSGSRFGSGGRGALASSVATTR
jgi:hypothetical protein